MIYLVFNRNIKTLEKNLRKQTNNQKIKYVKNIRIYTNSYKILFIRPHPDLIQTFLI